MTNVQRESSEEEFPSTSVSARQLPDTFEKQGHIQRSVGCVPESSHINISCELHRRANNSNNSNSNNNKNNAIGCANSKQRATSHLKLFYAESFFISNLPEGNNHNINNNIISNNNKDYNNNINNNNNYNINNNN
ncbi:hypothetical protein HELRODRAFT_166394 [Helobdella robusta]|uniref:Uncharacterized protein n=1 Tax=Helobdella robusta TaxID=6412 RepID=T1EY31_HELRO|nr:hypothetical protein HELRODRAFT_166394 [Helobdella robusta]ESN90690.1 hypothetical protein HELRODRAFT_166394 [Helobdella robusta]